MTLNCVASALSWVSIGAGLLSAILWMRAATASVRSVRPDAHYRDGTTVQGGVDYFQTVAIQARWNKFAAATASMAAACATASAAIVHVAGSHTH
ncbi:MAG: hypothetical protein ACRD63_14165 [Pyrinomonadaceae bacterium]